MRRMLITVATIIFIACGAFIGWYSFSTKTRQTELMRKTIGWQSLTEAKSWGDWDVIVVPSYGHANFSYYVEPNEEKNFIFEFLADGRIKHTITPESNWNNWLAGYENIGWKSDTSDSWEFSFGPDTGKVWIFAFQNDNPYAVKVNYQLDKYWYEPYWEGIYGGIAMIILGGIVLGAGALGVFQKKVLETPTQR